VLEFKDFIERLARGNLSNSPTQVSDSFAIQIMNMLNAEECIIENGAFVDIHILKQKIKTEKSIDIEIFNQLLK
jgi:allantoicase